jgi:beta-galactosidase
MDDPPHPVGACEPGFDDSGWRALDLPHDWGIGGPFNQDYPGESGKLAWWGVGWYRKRFAVPATDAGRRVFVEFDGAMSDVRVWINGKPLGGWAYGYSSFELELTAHLHFGGDNVLAVRLDNPADSSRWYPGGGIYRNVWLRTTGPVNIPRHGQFVTTPRVATGSASVRIATRIANQSATAADITVNTRVVRGGSDLPPVAGDPKTLKIPAGGMGAVECEIEVPAPALWCPESPALYVALTEVHADGCVIDRIETVFGIRLAEFTTDDGFHLNGRRVQIKGVCLHHDLGALGTAVNTRAIARRIGLLREMGCNAIRSSHNPPAPELLDLCDRMGMLVIVEAFDCWETGKKPNDYSRHFAAWHERDLRAMVRRDRNHPCVILWSTGNEISEQWPPDRHAISGRLRQIVHGEDPTRPATAACNLAAAGTNGFQKTVDVFGYNYKPHEYAGFREANPSIPLYGSETASTVSSRGEYFFPVAEGPSEGCEDFHVSSYDLCSPDWAGGAEAEFRGQDENRFVAGEFVWTGFDYLGEPTPYNSDSTNLLNFSDPAKREKMRKELDELSRIAVPSRSSYFGILDLAGFKKDRFYLYQARWRPDFPMAHILPHWNWPERLGRITPVHVYTSGDEAELFLDGISLGRRTMAPREYRLRWDDVKYAPGALRVVTWKNGKPWAESSLRTTGAPARVTITADRVSPDADGHDLVHASVSITDRSGLTVPRANNLVRFTVEGPGDLVAVDNGDPTSHAPFHAPECRAFNGLCLAIIRTRAGAGGEIRLSAASDGLEPARIQIISRPGGTGTHRTKSPANRIA